MSLQQSIRDQDKVYQVTIACSTYYTTSTDSGGSLDSIVRIVTRYGLDGLGIASRWGVRFSAPIQNGSEAPPSLIYDAYQVFPRANVARAWL